MIEEECEFCGLECSSEDMHDTECGRLCEYCAGYVAYVDSLGPGEYD